MKFWKLSAEQGPNTVSAKFIKKYLEYEFSNN